MRLEIIMPYEMALELEQEQREAQGQLAEECREAEVSFSRIKVGKHSLCPCGLKQAQDCNCNDRPF
jgi:hypothetical protein